MFLEAENKEKETCNRSHFKPLVKLDLAGDVGGNSSCN